MPKAITRHGFFSWHKTNIVDPYFSQTFSQYLRVPRFTDSVVSSLFMITNIVDPFFSQTFSQYLRVPRFADSVVSLLFMMTSDITKVDVICEDTMTLTPI